MRNWAAHLQKLNLPYAVIALDEATLQICSEQGIQSMAWDVNLSSRSVLCTQGPVYIPKAFVTGSISGVVLNLFYNVS